MRRALAMTAGSLLLLAGTTGTALAEGCLYSQYKAAMAAADAPKAEPIAEQDSRLLAMLEAQDAAEQNGAVLID